MRIAEVALKVGSVNESVTVEAGASLVETRSTGISTVVDNQRVVELPLHTPRFSERHSDPSMTQMDHRPSLSTFSDPREGVLGTQRPTQNPARKSVPRDLFGDRLQ